jgi:hypothetical protein
VDADRVFRGEPAHDDRGLRQAAKEFFEEGYAYPEANRILAQTAPELQAEARKNLLPPRTLPEGYYIWVAHLIWLERVLEIVPLQLSAIEVEGLILLKQERNRFQAAHPPCPYCGLPNEAHALLCRECGGQIGK